MTFNPFFHESYRVIDFRALSDEESAVTLEVPDHLIDITCTTGSYTVYLPPVASAQGHMYVFYATDGTGDVTVADQDDSIGWTDLHLDETDDCLVLMSDGRHWLPLYSNLSA